MRMLKDTVCSRSLDAIDRADVCLIMIDAAEGITEQDTKIAGYVHEAGKASIVVVNKWDLVEKETNTMKNFKIKVKEGFNFMMYAHTVLCLFRQLQVRGWTAFLR